MSVYIDKTANVSPEAKIGDGTKVWINSQIREGAVIGANCNISKDTYIDKNVKIGDRVKIQNGVSVYDGVTLEDDVFVGPNVAFTNDKFPRSFNTEWKVIPTLVKQGASIGSNATIVCGLTIGEYAMVGAGAVVTKDVEAYTLVLGNPAKVKNYICKCGNAVGWRGKQCKSCEDKEAGQVPEEAK
jgi:UDP-2-acetamido-3-amino-2,3-dideoxy-glucuronate N-acetyltransferase